MKVLLAAGGTGGHIFPAIAIAEEMKQQGSEILFVGTSNRMESWIVPKYSIPFTTIWISGFRRGFYLSNLLVPLKLIVSLFQSMLILKKFKPSVVAGTGGFVCGPVLFVASLMKIPTVIHESNSYPGLTTRLLEKKVTQLLLAYEQSRKYLRRKDCLVVGTPTLSQYKQISRTEVIQKFNLDPRKKTVLVFGGSQGSAIINEAIKMLLPELLKKNIQLIWQTGQKHYGELQHLTQNGVYIAPFIDDMNEAYAVATVVVCRAGAVTIAEITNLGKAAVLIPFRQSAEDHQYFNASMLEKAGAAKMIEEQHLQEMLYSVLIELLENDDLRSSIENKCKTFGQPDAVKKIVEILKRVH